MQHGEALARESGEPSLAEAVASGAFERLDERMRALCRYALKLTRTPGSMQEGDVSRLRTAGFDDRAIVDANQVVAYFNYVNRVADGLGVELEDEWPAERRQKRSYALAATAPTADVPTVGADELPWLSVDQVRELDRVMTDELGISLEGMMENAGRALADVARRLLGGVAGKRLLVLAGPGANGGGGLVAARHLAVAGADVEVRLTAPAERLARATAAQYVLVERLGIAIERPEAPVDADLVLDALLGYGLTGDPRGSAAELIELTGGRRVIALDVPSGLELATGTLRAPHVRAEATVALAAPKAGLRTAPEVVGALYVADISVPPLVFAGLGLPYRPPFTAGPLVRVVVSSTDK